MERVRPRLARCTLFIAAWLLAIYPLPLFSQEAAAPAPFEITTTPSTGAPGETRELTIQPKDEKNCPNPSPKLTLVAPQGNGINVKSQKPVQAGCVVIADITITEDATPNSTVMLRLEDTNHQIFGQPFPFNIAGPVTPPGAVPPGMNPALDVMWGVVPDEIVHDEFGHYISKKFFCIEVVIGNDTGYPVQIVSVGFTMDGKSKNYEPLPSSGYETTRAMLEVGQAENVRSFILGGISLLTSFSAAGIPFLNHTSFATDYNGAVAVLGSPVTNGIKVLWPDLTIPELNRLDSQILRDGLLIPNNTQVRTVVFLSKHAVLAFIAPTDTTNPNSESVAGSDTECVKPAWVGCSIHVTAKTVMDKLGSLRLIGNEIKYINRVQVNSTPNAPSMSLAPSSLDFTSLTNAPQKVVLTNTGTAPLSISKIDPATGTSADDFSQSNDCPTTLAPGAACTITITFAPAAEGKHQATLSISDDAANSPQTVSLTANWSSTLAAVPPDFTAEPPKDMTLTNNTGEPLTIKSIQPTGGQAADFNLGDNNCQTTLVAGQQCSTAVQFTGPGKKGEQTTLAIRDNNDNLIGLVNVTGPK